VRVEGGQWATPTCSSGFIGRLPAGQKVSQPKWAAWTRLARIWASQTAAPEGPQTVGGLERAHSAGRKEVELGRRASELQIGRRAPLRLGLIRI